MTNRKDSTFERKDRRKLSHYSVLVIGLALFGLLGIYFLAISDLEDSYKTYGLLGIVAGFLLLSAISYRLQSGRCRESDLELPLPLPGSDVESGLNALEEASSFFSGSLKPSDSFRLACSRIKDVVEFGASVLYLLDESRTRLVVVEVDGVETQDQKGRSFAFDEELAGQCYSNRQVETDRYLSLDSNQTFASTVAIPLCRDKEVFGVLQLYFDLGFDLDGFDHSVFEAISIRVAPMMLGSIAFERSQENALTDITTDLPNERAFYLVLEAQVAEAQRNRDLRPLTILAIDIKNFDEINQKYGHSTGDRVLNFVAQVVKDNLRQMDFFARSLNDEFLAVLPTADKEISLEIIARIHTGFYNRKLSIDDSESIEIELNIGWSSFGDDGETPAQLLNLALLRKEQSKSAAPQNVLWFPQEVVK